MLGLSEYVETKYMLEVYDAPGASPNNLQAVYNDKYGYQGLAASWRELIEEQHLSVESRVKRMLEHYSAQMYALNRPNTQANPDIVRYVDSLVDEVRNLQPWNIQYIKP